MGEWEGELTELIKGWGCCFRKRKEGTKRQEGNQDSWVQKGQEENFLPGFLPTLQRGGGGWKQGWWPGDSWWSFHQRCGNGNHHMQGQRHSHPIRTTMKAVMDIHWAFTLLSSAARSGRALSFYIVGKPEASQQEWGHPLFFSDPNTNPPAYGPISHLMLWCRKDPLPLLSGAGLLSPSQWRCLSGCSLSLWYRQGSFLISNN